MSEYGAITPTTNGLTMITESVVKKKPIVFTKIAIGDGALTNQNIETLTALIRQKQEAPIHIVTDKGAGLADVSAVITNVGLSTGYYARELGVFAKVGDAGQEKLFAYTNAGANASYSPADGSLDEKLITVTFKIGTGATLKVALNSQVYLTLGNLEKHNTSSSAHADIRRMFNSYLPLTGGTLTGRLYVNDAVFMGTETSQYGNFIERSKAGTMYLASGKSESSNLSWFNVDGYFKYTDTAEMCVIKRDENSNILARAFLLDQDNKTRFPGEVYSNEKLLATKEYVDGKKWGSTSITDGAITPTKLDRAYLPLTGGTLTGSLSIDGGNNIVHYIGPGGGTIGGNLNLGNATKTKSTALCCQNRPMWWDNNSSRSLALEADVSEHNASISAHKPILDAIKAITGTSAFNTAPSKKITEIITLLGQGGIVSSKLDAAAGFVKFSNGFTIQWGKPPSTQTSSVIEGRNNKFTLDLPIRYATPFISIAIDFGNGAVGVSTTLTNTQVNAHANQTTLYWSYIAVGIA